MMEEEKIEADRRKHIHINIQTHNFVFTIITATILQELAILPFKVNQMIDNSNLLIDIYR